MFRGLNWTIVAAIIGIFALHSIVRGQDSQGPVGSVHGTVMKNGKPAGNTPVRIFKIEPATQPTDGAPNKKSPGGKTTAAKNPQSPKMLRQVMTDKNGEFIIADLLVGDYTLNAGVRAAQASATVTVTPGQTSEVKLEIKTGSTDANQHS